MRLPVLKKAPLKKPAEQSSEEKMTLLGLEARRILGQKWDYYQKIKHAEDGFLGSRSILTKMKATRSALKFTSKNTRRQYNVAYQNCLKEIKKFAVTEEVFPELPDEDDNRAVKEMIPRQDAVIIGWTPIKFLLPFKFLREKGAATQRHTEGLLAKLTFKLAGYYAAPENWDNRNLSFYLHKITAESAYQEVVEKLEPLKKDLYTFSQDFQPFAFGAATTSKAVTSDSDAFDDAMEVESFESRVRTLYWYAFIYKALESFMIRYYLTLVSATASPHAIKYLSNIFEPAISRVIELSIIFDGSFDTDRSKKSFRKPFLTLRTERKAEPLVKSVKTKKGMFETYNYVLPMVSRYGAAYQIRQDISPTSFWWRFVEMNILGKNRSDFELELSYTSYHSQGESVRELEDQNRSLSDQQAQFEREKTDLESEVRKLTEELINLEKTYREENPEEIKRQLRENRSEAESERKRIEQDRKKREEEKTSFQDEQRKLAGIRDVLLEEEGQLKEKATEFQKNLDNLEKDLAAANSRLSKLENEKKPTREDTQSQAPQKIDKDQEVQRADIEGLNVKIEDEKNRLKDIKEKLGAIAKRRQTEIAAGFERVQEKKEGVLTEIEVLDRSMLEINQRLARIEEDQTALDERDSRFADSKKKTESATKNAEKNLERVVKGLESARDTITRNKEQIEALKTSQQNTLDETKQKLESLNSIETRSQVFSHILSTLIVCSGKQKDAWEKVLERFKDRIVADQELAKKEVEDIKKEAQKKEREMTKKVSKLKALKQDDAALSYQEEVEKYQQDTKQKCQRIIKNAKEEASIQKQRITTLFHNVSKIRKRNDSISAKHMADTISRMEDGEAFIKSYLNVLTRLLAENYEKSLDPLYQSLFAIFNPSLLVRVGLVQAMEKSSGDEGEKLTLSEKEKNEWYNVIQGVKNQITSKKNDLFECQINAQSEKVSLDKLLNLRLDNDSLKLLLSFKITSASKPGGEKLDPSLIEKYLHLNSILSPVAEHDLQLKDKENETDPLKKLDIGQFRKLVAAAE